MGVDPNSRPVLKAVDTYFDDLSDLQQMLVVSKLLNAQSDSTPRVQQKLGFYLSYTNFSKIKKLLDLLEYLTFMSPAKLPEIINGEKFMENYCSALMEPEVQTPMLNLIRLWCTKYEQNKQQISRVVELAENLSNFGIDVPATYVSKYEGLKPEEPANTPENKNDNKSDSSPRDKMSFHPSEIGALSVRAQSLREQAGLLVNDSTFLRLPKIAREDNAQELIEDITGLIIEFNNVLESDLGQQFQEMVQGVVDELKKYHKKIRDAVDQNDTMEVEEEGVVYGPQPPPRDYDKAYDDHFPSMMDKNGFLREKSVSSDKDVGNKFKNGPYRTFVTDSERSDIESHIQRHLPPSVIIPYPAYASGPRDVQNPSPSDKNKVQDESPPKDNDIKSDKPLDKELCSKLIIRKKFVSPTNLTNQLTNTCFSGIPLFTNIGLPNQQKQV